MKDRPSRVPRVLVAATVVGFIVSAAAAEEPVEGSTPVTITGELETRYVRSSTEPLSGAWSHYSYYIGEFALAVEVRPSDRVKIKTKLDVEAWPATGALIEECYFTINLSEKVDLMVGEKEIEFGLDNYMFQEQSWLCHGSIRAPAMGAGFPGERDDALAVEARIKAHDKVTLHATSWQSTTWGYFDPSGDWVPRDTGLLQSLAFCAKVEATDGLTAEVGYINHHDESRDPTDQTALSVSATYKKEIGASENSLEAWVEYIAGGNWGYDVDHGTSTIQAGAKYEVAEDLFVAFMVETGAFVDAAAAASYSRQAFVGLGLGVGYKIDGKVLTYVEYIRQGSSLTGNLAADAAGAYSHLELGLKYGF